MTQPPNQPPDITSEARRAQRAIYLLTNKNVAKDLNRIIDSLLNHIEALEEQAAQSAQSAAEWRERAETLMTKWDHMQGRESIARPVLITAILDAMEPGGYTWLAEKMADAVLDAVRKEQAND